MVKPLRTGPPRSNMRKPTAMPHQTTEHRHTMLRGTSRAENATPEDVSTFSYSALARQPTVSALWISPPIRRSSNYVHSAILLHAHA